MNTILPLLQSALHHPFYVLLVLWIVFKYKDVKDILSESDGRLSSRRVIAMLAAHNLFRMMNYCIEHQFKFDTTMGWTLVVLILICLGLMVISDLSGLLDKLNSLKSTTTTTATKSEKTKSIEEEIKQ